MGLTLTVLGSSGTYAGPRNACSGYLVEDGTTSVWVDTGPGTLANLQDHVDLETVDAVVVSHSHPDHWLELPVFRNALKFGPRREGVPVFGTEATRRGLVGVLGDDDPYTPTFEWSDISDGDRFTIGSIQFACSRTDHPVETMALRIDGGGSSLVYSADTGPGWSPEVFAPGIDMALLEATLLADREGQSPHLSARQAGTMAAAAGAEKLVITHLWPTSDPEDHRTEAEEAFGRPVEIAVPHARFEV